MKVTKRSGQLEDVSFDKITKRIKLMLTSFNKYITTLTNIDPIYISQKICSMLFNGISTSELDELTANICMSMCTQHTDFGELASRIVINNYQKNTKDTFMNVVEKLYNNIDVNNLHAPLISTEFYSIVVNNSEYFESILDHDRDYFIDYFGFKTLYKAYLLKVNKKPIENIQHMWLRCAIGLHGEDLDKVKETYDLLSQKYFIHATPTLYHSGTARPQLSSCFLENTEVLTINEGVKNIQDVQIGDEVVTHTGNIRKVVQLHKNPLNDRDIYELQMVCSEKKIYVTGNHRFLSYNKNREIIWKSIENLKEGDNLAIPKYNGIDKQPVIDITKYISDIDTNINKIWKINNDIAVFLGMFFNEGCYTDNSIKFWVSSKNPKKIMFIQDIGEKLFGISSKTFSSKDTTFIEFVSKDLINAIEKIHLSLYSIIATWDKSLMINFLVGIITSMHGIIYKDHCEFNYNLDIDNLYHLIRIYGFRVYFSESKEYNFHLLLTKEFKEVLSRINYEYNIKNPIKKAYPADIVDGYTFIEIKKLKKTTLKPDYVYTLGIEKDHSYTVEGGLICENCFLMGVKDSIKGIYKNITDCALISKWAGGIGVHISNIRSNDSYIRKTAGRSTGIIPMMKVYNDTAKYVNQSGRRPGSIAMYLEPHHADIMEFLDAKRPHGDNENKARDLFFALWISNYFMYCVENDKDWYLMNPDDCRGLNDVYSDKYVELYNKYVSEGKYVKKLKAREVWEKIIITQIETGVPYMCYKDACNEKSNQKNIGTIKSSNLCVSGDTLILTKNGYYPIKDFENRQASIWNGEEFSNVIVKKTGVNQPMVEVFISNGSSLKCTPYHKFFIKGDFGKTKIDAKDLKEGDELIDFSFPVVIGYHDYNCAYSRGYKFFTNDDLIPINFNINSKLRWLEGFVDSVCDPIVNNKLIIKLLDLKYTEKLALLLNTLGINTHINKYNTYNSIELDGSDLTILKKLGFNPRYIDLSKVEDKKIKNNTYRVVSIEELKEPEDTYCFNEPKKHAGIFNGIITGQCSEIVMYSDKDEYAVCNLASISLPKFLIETTWRPDGHITLFSIPNCPWCVLAKALLTQYDISFTEIIENKIRSYEMYPRIFITENYSVGYTELWNMLKPVFDYDKLHEVTKIVTYNLNRVIDINYYPLKETKRSNFKHRPIGIGVQGLADLFIKFRMPFDSEKASELNRNIFETMYHAALESSCEIAEKYGTYESYPNSPISQGIFQFELWDKYNEGDNENTQLSGMWNFENLREKILKYGVRNSLLLTVMPTASTSQILGNQECIEPFTSNLYTRRTIAGEFTVVNKYLITDLYNMGLWNDEMKQKLIYYKGSIQNIKEIPNYIKNIYKTAWEIKQKVIIDLAADRGRFICQSQSLNLFVQKPTYSILSSIHFYGWKKGLKTGSYYIRSKPASASQNFTIDPELEKKLKNEEEIGICESCSG